MMGLMGYVRSGLRLHWHVYGVVRDNSPDAYTPTLGFATRVVSVTVLIFFLFVGIVFWLASLAGKHRHGEPALAHAPAAEPAPAGGGALAPAPAGTTQLGKSPLARSDLS
jgi:hypothetical protein